MAFIVKNHHTVPTCNRRVTDVGFSLEVPFRTGNSVILEGDGVKMSPQKRDWYNPERMFEVPV